MPLGAPPQALSASLLELKQFSVGYELYRFSAKRRGILGLAGLRPVRYTVVHNISAGIVFNRGLVALTGVNGAGKTSLLRAIAGHLPSTGGLLWGGCDLSQLNPYERFRRGVVMVPADDLLFPDFTVKEYRALLRGMSLNGECDPWTVAASLFGSEADSTIQFLWSNCSVGNLSGGQRRLLSLLRLLGRSWSLVLLDEPMAGLSPSWKAAVMRMIQHLTRGGSVLMTEQYSMIGAALELGAQVLELRDSSIGEWRGDVHESG